MRYPLKNGTSVTIRKPTTQDAHAIVSIISTADSETLFLARDPGQVAFVTLKDYQGLGIRIQI